MLKSRLPSAYNRREDIEAGGLMSSGESREKHEEKNYRLCTLLGRRTLRSKKRASVAFQNVSGRRRSLEGAARVWLEK